jgi:hypothetical protein
MIMSLIIGELELSPKTVTDNHDMSCPQCHKDDQIDVVASIWVRLTPDGTDDSGALGGSQQEWDNNSHCICRACGYHSNVGKFTINHEYLFDVKLFASFRVKAHSVKDARIALAAALDCASVNAGEVNGEPLVGEASVDGELELIEKDGEPT